MHMHDCRIYFINDHDNIVSVEVCVEARDEADLRSSFAKTNYAPYAAMELWQEDRLLSRICKTSVELHPSLSRIANDR
jgi:hypothetical protein